MSSDDEFFLNGSDLFQEPEEFLPKQLPFHFANYKRINPPKNQPSDLNLRLIGSSPLWGHLLWNAGIFTANFLDNPSNEHLIQNKNILELGAASALPSLICSYHNPKKIVITDYPDFDLMENIKFNVKNLIQDNQNNKDNKDNKDNQNILVKGYIWGNDTIDLLNFINKDNKQTEKFHLIILSDLVFNHTEHHKLLKTCRQLLSKDGKCLVVFTPHRPKLIDKDLNFFELSKSYDFISQKIDLVTWKPMFEEEEETIEIRSRVYSYYLLPNWS
ncbi:S-adenosylmethionine-dependent methyltransferase ASCRUDRAFT_8693 [Ascoidea rubescens DSM 1968]|uniref:Protein N-terminal and lysine N-methyltransferase EFM7 n=1 Tax=Ascoidea rubescens DSM 1968 TaxID=1344418 RepID=A0A1D2VFM7_9ASCO|nr:hypothetical protein ASCRUDRAFT_8693 [Ascoidea rubescens DSM 1968]ODV60474.1 hypothetical protein ASCRUDRAFT_8693 [Ascoidea rubescens DSM 1968]